MGRIQRYQMIDNQAIALDLTMTTPGKVMFMAQGGNLRIGYTESDVTSATGNFFTIFDSTQQVFDCGPGSGFLAQNQLLYFSATAGTPILEIWIANQNN